MKGEGGVRGREDGVIPYLNKPDLIANSTTALASLPSTAAVA